MGIGPKPVQNPSEQQEKNVKNPSLSGKNPSLKKRVNNSAHLL